MSNEILMTFMILITEIEVIHPECQDCPVIEMPITQRAEFKEKSALTGTPLFFDSLKDCRRHMHHTTVPTLQSLKKIRDSSGKFKYGLKCVRPEEIGVRNPNSVDS